ncbi:MspA family porin [Mycobacterium sp. 155]|uniref:MspA family porin n=1 Tax=Mycobacterium sp. 155 TaxID=1157943 RepID=UPI0003768551|nr:MspA family porin [Mycobacterium sp. 155]
MLHRFGIPAAALLVAVAAAPPALADPPAAADTAPAPDAAAPDAGPPPDTGAVISGPPGIAHTPDGRTLTVTAKDETQLPIAPLTTSLSSREWLVGATFTGEGMSDVKGGTLETGYQIGCGIEMDKVKLNGSIGLGTGNFAFDPSLSDPSGRVGSVFTMPIQGQIEVEPRPGTVTNVVVDKKSFKGNKTRVTVRDIHIKIDNCVGASSLRSYAVLTSSGTDADDIVAYYGITKTF